MAAALQAGDGEEYTKLQARPTVQDYLKRWGALDNEYIGGNWRSRQSEVIQYTQPYRGRFDLDQQNKQPRKDQSIVNDTASDSAKKLVAAAQTGITSPARKWFGLTSTLPELADDHEVRDYFDNARDVILQLFAESNFYKVLTQVYSDLAGPATSLAFIEEDQRDVIRAVHRPVGQYRLACDSRGRVSTAYTRYSMTVEQVVEQFCVTPQGKLDMTPLTERTRGLWRTKQYDQWIDVLHVTEPRTVREAGRIDSRNKPWSSCWMEWSTTRATGAVQMDGAAQYLLKESGVDEQWFIAPRWDVIGEDAYGSESPGFQCIGDVKSLQGLENAGAALIGKIVDPPMNVPPALRSGSLVPGAKNQLEQDSRSSEFKPSYVPEHGAVTVEEEKARQFEMRIRRAYYGDILFLISNDPRTSPATAEEIKAKREERLLGLGGFFGRFSDEGLTIAINRAFAIAQRKRLIGPPPAKLVRAAMKGGRVIKAEFMNSIAEAQKAQGVQPILGWVNDAMAMAKESQRPDILDSIDFDGVMETTADMRGVPAKLVVPADQRQAVRADRAQKQAAAQAAESMAKTAPAVAQLSNVNQDGLRDVLRQFSPAAEAEGAGNGL